LRLIAGKIISGPVGIETDVGQRVLNRATRLEEVIRAFLLRKA